MPRSFPIARLALLSLALALPCAPLSLHAQDSLTAVASGVVMVPDLAGRTVEDARDLLRAAGLNLGDLEEVGGRGVPGTVARQRPRAGATAKPGEDVHLSLVRGRRAVMPAIQGLPLERAQELLREAGLTPGDIIGGEAGPGTVVNGHTYEAGRRVRAGEVINISLTPPGGRITPQVATRPEPAPQAPPTTAPNTQNQQPPRQQPQRPAPVTDTPAPRVDSAAVPDVRRLGVAQARAALQAAGLTAAIDPALADSAGWTVASQLPLAGARIPAGGAVQLALAPPEAAPAPAVAAAPPPVAPPPLAGGLQAQPGTGGSGPAGTGAARRPLPWLLILLVLVLAVAAATAVQRMRARKRLPPPIGISARLTAAVAPRTELDGSPLGPTRLRFRVRAGLPAARMDMGPLFAQKEVPGD